ncbi:MAG: polysaccharide deacetylase family protein [Flavobacteriales bacterium]|nr:polysaccharide deacetylase family protein [Flavobacteriales bacterium]
MQIVKIPKFVQLLFPSLVWKKENSEKEIYLTFDDSPTPEFTYWILNLLSSLNIKATFFCVGESAEKHSKIIDEILNNGHQIGNHTYSHKNGFLCSNKTYLQDIDKCKNILPNTNLFRPPYGNMYPWQISKIKEKYKIIGMC